jgi:hypothetical protein
MHGQHGGAENKWKFSRGATMFKHQNSNEVVQIFMGLFTMFLFDCSVCDDNLTWAYSIVQKVMVKNTIH